MSDPVEHLRQQANLAAAGAAAEHLERQLQRMRELIAAMPGGTIALFSVGEVTRDGFPVAADAPPMRMEAGIAIALAAIDAARAAQNCACPTCQRNVVKLLGAKALLLSGSTP